MSDEASLLQRAYLFIEERKFNSAEAYLERVLDMNLQCSRAYIGKLLCRLQLQDIYALGTLDTYLASYDEFEKAIRFATEGELLQCNALKREKERTIQTYISKKKQEAAEIQTKILAQEQTMAENKKPYGK